MFNEKLLRITFFAFISLLIPAGPAFTACAQSATATLSGIVSDSQGAVVAGALVTAADAGRAIERRATTNGDGYFTITQLPPSSYTITIERSGFAEVKRSDVVLNVGDQSTLKIELRVAGVGETVTVNAADAPLVTESPAVATVVDRQFVENQPLNGRSFQTLIGLAPGVVFTSANLVTQGQFSVNGQRTSANYFTVDGVSANFGLGASTTLYEGAGGAVPSFSAQGGTNSLASVDAVQEFAIQTSTYAPEFGRQPGAQVQIVTRSGTNRLHGGVFDYLRNAVFDANNFFANAAGLERPAVKQNDFGFTLGGPVLLPRFGEGGPAFYDRRDQTFFFVSYEGLRLRQPFVTVPLRVPTLAARRAASGVLSDLLNAFPLPTGPDILDGSGRPTGEAGYIGSFTNPSRLDATSFRIDHTLGARLTLFGRFNYAPSEDILRARFCAASCAARITGKTETLTLGANFILSPRLTNDLRLNFSRSQAGQFYFLDDFGGATRPPASSLYPSFASPENSNFFAIFDGGNEDNTLSDGLFSNNRQRQFNVVDTVSYALGAHALKFGVDYRRLAPVALSRNFSRNLAFGSVPALIAGVVPTATVSSVDSPLFPVYDNFSVYAQDTWRARPRLTLTYGLRYEINPAPSERSGLPVTVTDTDDFARATLAPRGTRLYETTFDNFAPRVGVAYQLFPDRGTVLRGGFGVFHDLGTAFTGTAFSPLLAPNVRQIVRRNVTLDDPALSASPTGGALAPPYPRLFAYERGYELPRTIQYNLTLEQPLGSDGALSLAYVGAAGRRLARLTSLRRQSVLRNPSFTRIDFVTNDGTSNYNAFQTQYQRRLSRGFQALVSYTFAKSLDTASDESISNFQAPTTRLDPGQDRGPSAFDIRQTFSGAISYDLPSPFAPGFGRRVFGGFGIDSIFRARGATPIGILSGRDPFDLGITSVSRPDLVAGQPLYIGNEALPGGRRINPAAFDAATPLGEGRQGTLGRNVVRGLAFYQLDVSLRRRFSLSERFNLDFRVEGFNVFNRANFADPVGTLTDPNFGRATQTLNSNLGGLSPIYQIGGPRSLQFALKLQF